MNSRSAQPHIPALDGIRGLAILLVLLNHSWDFRPVVFGGSSSIEWGTLNNVMSSAGLGVQLFFVLSGFLITGLLLDAKSSPRYFSSFYGRRALRILPLYYGTLILFGLALHLRGSDLEEVFWDRLPWLVTFTQNIRITILSEWAFGFGSYTLGHFWSLAVEEQFYLAWPVVVLWCATNTLKRICYALIAVALLARVGFVWDAVKFDDMLGAFVFLPCASDSLAIGALIAVLVRESETALESKAWPLIGIGGLIWLASCLDMRVVASLGISGFSLMCGGVILAGLYRWPRHVFSNSMLRSFGKYSYAIYIFHVLLRPLIYPIKEEWGLTLFIPIFVSLSYGVGWLSWHLVEVHFLRLKRFLPLVESAAWKPQRMRSDPGHGVASPSPLP